MQPHSPTRQRRVVLASRSPRRLDLLRGLGFEPVVRPAAVHERREGGEAPAAYTRRLSLAKARAVARELELAQRDDISPFVVAADTVVALAEAVLEKPADEAEARAMLGRLSGRWHRVATSFTVLPLTEPAEAVTQTVEADVRFRRLSPLEIARYVASGEPLDKAGAYGIQTLGGFLVREIRGSYFTVVGLPVCELVEVLSEVGALTDFPFPREEVAA